MKKSFNVLILANPVPTPRYAGVARFAREHGWYLTVEAPQCPPVDWEGDGSQNAVTNELDVMCTKGITPVFISCKTCDAKTEALNELAILRDRFGGKMAKAAIVTAERGGAAMRNRASELGIDVIDLNDLVAGRIDQKLRHLMRTAK